MIWRLVRLATSARGRAGVGTMSANADLWHEILAVVTGSDGFSLALAVLLAAAAGFALERVHSFTGVTLAALAVFALAKFALALGLYRAHSIDVVFDRLWSDFAAMPMLTFIAYALLFAAVVALVAAARAALRLAR